MDVEYVDPADYDPPEDRFVLQVWLSTSDGAILFGATFERGPFDDLEFLREQLTDALPWTRVEPMLVKRMLCVQQRLFDLG